MCVSPSQLLAQLEPPSGDVPPLDGRREAGREAEREAAIITSAAAIAALLSAALPSPSAKAAPALSMPASATWTQEEEARHDEGGCGAAARVIGLTQVSICSSEARRLELRLELPEAPGSACSSRASAAATSRGVEPAGAAVASSIDRAASAASWDARL